MNNLLNGQELRHLKSKLERNCMLLLCCTQLKLNSIFLVVVVLNKPKMSSTDNNSQQLHNDQFYLFSQSDLNTTKLTMPSILHQNNIVIDHRQDVRKSEFGAMSTSSSAEPESKTVDNNVFDMFMHGDYTPDSYQGPVPYLVYNRRHSAAFLICPETDVIHDEAKTNIVIDDEVEELYIVGDVWNFNHKYIYIGSEVKRIYANHVKQFNVPLLTGRNGINVTSFYAPNCRVLAPSMFQGWGRLKEVVLSDDLTEIPSRCFYDCISLTEFRLPRECTILNSLAFYNCTELKKVYGLEQITQIQNYESLPLYCELDEFTITDKMSSSTQTAICNNLNIRKLIVDTPNLDFSISNKYIEYIDFGFYLEQINGYIYNCSNLLAVTFHTGHITYLKSGCIYNCPKLKEIIFKSTNWSQQIIENFEGFSSESLNLTRFEVPEFIGSVSSYFSANMKKVPIITAHITTDLSNMKYETGNNIQVINWKKPSSLFNNIDLSARKTSIKNHAYLGPLSYNVETIDV